MIKAVRAVIMEQNVKRSVQSGARLVTIQRFVWNVNMDILGNRVKCALKIVQIAKIILTVHNVIPIGLVIMENA